MTRPSFHPEAEREVVEAAQYYEARSPGLGRAFLDELERVIAEAQAAPLAAPLARGTVRRRRLRRFPYNLLSAVESPRVRIYAVAHVRRRPDYWIDRS